MTVAILATGDELIHGDTLNTNGRDMAHVLCSEGIPLGLQLTCSDKKEEIVACLAFLAKQHDILILTGGLGPTSDDLTRFALAQYTGDELVQHEKALIHVQERLRNAKVAMNEGNLQQCLFPKEATVLPNPYGSAVGCSYRWNGKLFILLPGPPRECLPMFHHFVLPLLQQTQRSQKQLLKWRIFGLAESEIAETLEKALAAVDCQTGYRLDVPYIEFKVRCGAPVVDKVKAIIDPLLAPHIIASTEQKASEALRQLIARKNQPLTLIDEVTGGLLQTLIDQPETHVLLNHAPQESGWFFHLTGLEEYWSKQIASGITQLTIHYRNQNREGEERHTLSHRSPLIVYYAAEWISYRLCHLMQSYLGQ